MNRTYSPAHSIERFAQVSAVLDYGHAPRPVALCAAGLGEDTWESVERHWIERLGSNDGAELAERFGATYAASVESFAPAPVEPTGDDDPTIRDAPVHFDDMPGEPTLELPGFWLAGRAPSFQPEPPSAPDTRRSRVTLLPAPPRELADARSDERTRELPGSLGGR